MREVIEAIDGAICLNVCLIPGRSCSRKAHCPAHPVWIEAQQAMMEVLSNATIASLPAPARCRVIQAPAIPSSNNHRHAPICLSPSRGVSMESLKQGCSAALRG